MTCADTTRQVTALLKSSLQVDVVGDVTVTVADPADLVAWAGVLPDCTVRAWRTTGSGHRFVSVAAAHEKAPVRGKLSVVLDAEDQQLFWVALLPNAELEPGDELYLSVAHLSTAWATT